MPKISVIVPVYNAEKTLQRCVESILRQTFSDYELILVDDGSLDSSYELCLDFARIDSRIKVLEQKNSGVSSARNNGINSSIGEWITFIDSDDWIDQNYLENFQIDLVEDDSSIVLQGITYDFLGKRNNKSLFEYDEGCFPLKKENVLDIDLLKDGCPVAKLFNRKILIENNLFFDKEISLNEDHIFVLKYYFYVNQVFVRRGLKYHYFFDSSIPSLTKIGHDVDECLRTSRRIYEAFEMLCCRLDCEPCQLSQSNTLRIFGFKQIVRAFKRGGWSKSQFEKCYLLWGKKFFVKCGYKGAYEKIFFSLLECDFFFVAFVWHCLSCSFEKMYKKMKMYVKMVNLWFT